MKFSGQHLQGLRVLSVIGAAVTLAGLAAPVLAQQAAAPAGAGTATSTNTSTSSSADNGSIQDIVITAEKHKSTIQNTPISLSAVSGAQLSAAGITSVEGLAHEVPGISMRSAGPGQTEYEARGLASNGGAAPTVGFYLDEVPLSPPALAQVGKVVIDPNLYDINRIEVLRGPQGTLYGSGSMGGTVKIITNEPRLDTFEGSVEATASGTQGGGLNGGGSLMLNLPLGDKWALRLVGSDSYRSGWIDNITVNPLPVDVGAVRGNVQGAPVQSVRKNANTEKLSTGRASLLFTPTDDTYIVATAMFQRMAMGGYDEFDSPPGSGPRAHYQAFPIQEGISDSVNIYSLKIVQNLGFAEFTSATAYWSRAESQVQDASESVFYTNAGGTPLVAIPYFEIDTTHQFSQEFRLGSTGDGALTWVTGAFFSNLHSTWVERSDNPVIPSGSGGIFDSYNPYRVVQTALFADGSYRLSDTLKFSTGVRWYRYMSQQDEYEWGFDGPSLFPPAAPLTTRASDKGINPRFNLSWSPTAELTAYVSASKGFRPGGANQVLPPPSQPPYCTVAPLTFGPDTVWNYEIGEKLKFLNNRVTLNSDFFYIKWNAIQQAPLLACGYQYDTNAGDGRSFGPEVEINARVTDEWTLGGSAAYTDAKITHPNAVYTNFLQNISPGGSSFCPAAGSCTAPILNVAKETASVSVTYTTLVMDDWKLMARMADSFTGPTYDEAFYFGIKLPSYSLVNARASIAKGPWTASLFVDNLTNKTAELTANNTSFQFNIPSLVRFATNQPRTLGTQVSYRF